LLTQAVTHRSWCAEHPGAASNERLEFLGDAVLGLVVTDRLFRSNPDLAEGGMAKARAQIVSSTALAAVAVELGLGEALLLGRGEHRSGGREKQSILADALEAVIGAVWLDGGMAAADTVVTAILGDRLEVAAAGPGGLDFKTRLQEAAAHRGESGPHYELGEAGPDHAKRFTATVRLGSRVWGTGSGRSKKEAEQAAAADAFDRLGVDGGDAVGGGGDA
jgi:ribonuclease-3